MIDEYTRGVLDAKEEIVKLFKLHGRIGTGDKNGEVHVDVASEIIYEALDDLLK